MMISWLTRTVISRVIWEVVSSPIWMAIWVVNERCWNAHPTSGPSYPELALVTLNSLAGLFMSSHSAYFHVLMPCMIALLKPAHYPTPVYIASVVSAYFFPNILIDCLLTPLSGITLKPPCI